MNTYLKKLDGDNVAHLPHHLPYPHGCAHSVTWHWPVVGVVVHMCCEGCGRSMMAGGSGGCWQEW